MSDDVIEILDDDDNDDDDKNDDAGLAALAQNGVGENPADDDAGLAALAQNGVGENPAVDDAGLAALAKNGVGENPADDDACLAALAQNGAGEFPITNEDLYEDAGAGQLIAVTAQNVPQPTPEPVPLPPPVPLPSVVQTLSPTEKGKILNFLISPQADCMSEVRTGDPSPLKRPRTDPPPLSDDSDSSSSESDSEDTAVADLSSSAGISAGPKIISLSTLSSVLTEDEPTPITHDSVTNSILARFALKSKTGVNGINFHLGYKGSKDANSKIKSTLKELISKGSVEEILDGAPKKYRRAQYRIKVLQNSINPSVMPSQPSVSVIPPAVDQNEDFANRTGEGIVLTVESNFKIYKRRCLDRIESLVEKMTSKGNASDCWVKATRNSVYMGAMYDKEGSQYDYANYAEEISLATMKKRLLNHALEWNWDQLEKFRLQNFFKPNPDGKGYVEAERELISIDHIIPQSFGGYDHPRNYIIMTKSLNSSYKDTSLDEKLSLIGKPETRKLKMWLQSMHQKQRAIVKKALQEMTRRE